MATNDTLKVSSGPADQPRASAEVQRLAVPELVEILTQLGAHRRKVYEQTYGDPPWTREQSDAYWHHPVVWACKWLEQRLAIDRHDLEDAAFRLTTPLGLRGMAPLIAPDGEPDKKDNGQPDWLWMIPKFRELDRDGTTARLWQLLVEDYRAILADSGMLVPLGNGGEDDQAEAELANTTNAEGETPAITTLQRDVAISGLPRRFRKACLSLMYAELKAGRELDDKTAYETICDGEFDEQILDQHPELRELSGYSPPDSLKTWREYVSNARTALNDNKYDRRNRITPGRSVVEADQIEYQGRGE